MNIGACSHESKTSIELLLMIICIFTVTVPHWIIYPLRIRQYCNKSKDVSLRLNFRHSSLYRRNIWFSQCSSRLSYIILLVPLRRWTQVQTEAPSIALWGSCKSRSTAEASLRFSYHRQREATINQLRRRWHSWYSLHTSQTHTSATVHGDQNARVKTFSSRNLVHGPHRN
jgi:hypothetical protein